MRPDHGRADTQGLTPAPHHLGNLFGPPPFPQDLFRGKAFEVFTLAISQPIKMEATNKCRMKHLPLGCIAMSLSCGI